MNDVTAVAAKPRGRYDYDSFDALRARLATAIAESPATLHERAWLTAMLSTLLEALAPQVDFPTRPLHQQAFALLGEVLGRSCNRALLTDARPAWLEPRLLDDLQAACRRWHAAGPEPSGEQVYVPVDDALQRRLATDARLLDWCQRGLGVQLAFTGRANFIHYRDEFQRCAVHADNPEHYEYNCLVGVLHDADADAATPRSVLRIFESDGITDVLVEPGSAVVFHSSAIPHGRTPLQRGERLSLLSIGFRPAGGSRSFHQPGLA